MGFHSIRKHSQLIKEHLEMEIRFLAWINLGDVVL